MLLSFGIGVAAYIGCGALLLALMTLVYATTLYHKRHLYMVAKRQDVDYYVRSTPTLLTVGLIVLYATNFACRCILFFMIWMKEDLQPRRALFFVNCCFSNTNLPAGKCSHSLSSAIDLRHGC